MNMGGKIMNKENDFSNAISNQYAKKIKKQITIKVNSDVVDYFKEEAEVTGIPYQTLINLYLSDCVKKGKKLVTTWE